MFHCIWSIFSIWFDLERNYDLEKLSFLKKSQTHFMHHWVIVILPLFQSFSYSLFGWQVQRSNRPGGSATVTCWIQIKLVQLRAEPVQCITDLILFPSSPSGLSFLNNTIVSGGNCLLFCCLVPFFSLPELHAEVTQSRPGLNKPVSILGCVK